METEKFYDASFSGNHRTDRLTKDGIYDVSAKGTLVVHGVKQARIIISKIKIAKGNLKIDSNFNLLITTLKYLRSSAKKSPQKFLSP